MQCQTRRKHISTMIEKEIKNIQREQKKKPRLRIQQTCCWLYLYWINANKISGLQKQKQEVVSARNIRNWWFKTAFCCRILTILSPPFDTDLQFPSMTFLIIFISTTLQKLPCLPPYFFSFFPFSKEPPSHSNSPEKN